MVKETKLYDQLGASPTATQDEIKKAYRYVHRQLPFLYFLSALLFLLRSGSHRKCIAFFVRTPRSAIASPSITVAIVPTPPLTPH